MLKSPHSGREWPLTLLLAGPWSNPHRHRYGHCNAGKGAGKDVGRGLRRVPGHACGRRACSLTSAHVRCLPAVQSTARTPALTRRYPGRLSAALTDLDPVDAALLEFHVIARPGFHTFCTFLAATARAPAWPPLGGVGGVGGGGDEAGREEGDGGGRRRRRRRARQRLARRAVLGWRSGGGEDEEAAEEEQEDVEADGGDGGRGYTLDVGTGPQRCGWLDEEGEEIENELELAESRPSYMIISPFFGLPAGEYASLLLQHMRYHDVLGVRRYLVYVEAGASALAAEPRVQVGLWVCGEEGWGERQVVCTHGQ